MCQNTRLNLFIFYFPDKIHLKFDFPFYAQRRADGEIYIKCLYDFVKYEYDIGGDTTFFADNLYLGEEEVSKYTNK